MDCVAMIAELYFGDDEAVRRMALALRELSPEHMQLISLRYGAYRRAGFTDPPIYLDREARWIELHRRQALIDNRGSA